MIDHYRMPWELLMGGLFVLLLVLFAGKTGLRAVLSFLLTVLMIWKVMVPPLSQRLGSYLGRPCHNTGPHSAYHRPGLWFRPEMLGRLIRFRSGCSGHLYHGHPVH